MDNNRHFIPLLAIFLGVNIIASSINHIDDTDETYGYWEPLHYLLYGVGLQTWEYAPQYSIRTYAFIYPLYAYANVLAGMGLSKMSIFTLIRASLGACTSYAEAKYISAVITNFGTEMGYFVFLFIIFSPGMFFCGTSYLPSAACCVLLMLANANWMTGHIYRAIFVGSVAVLCTGWPFVGILFLPMGVHMLYSVATSASHGKLANILYALVQLIVVGVIIVIAIEAVVLKIDQKYYDKWTSPTLNILLYNAIGGSGDELYGVEPASYYMKNLLLNTGMSWLLTIVSPLVGGVSFCLSRNSERKNNVKAEGLVGRANSGIIAMLLVQLTLWLGVLFYRPHKEERFLYPIYPLLAFLAAFTLRLALKLMADFFVRLNLAFVGHGPTYPGMEISSASLITAKRAMIVLVTIVSMCLFSARVTSTYTNYRGYMQLWEKAGTYIRHRTPICDAPEADFVSVCTGSEWYQFPSHFHLPECARLQFIDDGFTGILPQHFAPVNGTFIEPLQPFNDKNREETSRYMDIHQCDYLVLLIDTNKPIPDQDDTRRLLLLHDLPSRLHSTPPSALEDFDKVLSEKVISPEYSPSSLLRAFYIPLLTTKSVKFKQYTLYQSHRA
mmetsp:Transcript_2333/g.3677  ORF Transcript_2333/g.3677 Transcript_2333/m.3677 type:complete len:612 (-) Transcript_2333:129-1964(-)